jgi:predicted permease
MAQKLSWLCDTREDAKFAARMFGKSPVFSGLLALTVGLGIGASTAIFSFVSAMVLRPLPYPQPDRIVAYQKVSNATGARISNVTPERFAMLRDHGQSYEAVAITFGARRMNVALPTGSVSVPGQRVSKDYFRVLGVGPLIGREFTAAEDAPHGPNAVILSYELWRTVFGEDRQAPGKLVRIGGVPYEVAGIMPASFHNYPRAALWLPLRSAGHGNDWNYSVAGRLKQGATLAQADAEAKALLERLRASSPGLVSRDERVAIAEYRDTIGANYRRPLFFLLAAAGIVLLITCINVANLLVARAIGRTRELVVRAALGAGAGRLARQMLAESGLIALLGGACAAGLGWLGMTALNRTLPKSVNLFQTPRLDWNTLLFTAALALLTGLAFGLAPARQAARRNMADALKELSGRTTADRAALLRRQAMVGGQTALCVVLLVAAGLAIRTFQKLRAVNPGFDPAPIRTASMNLNADKTSSAGLNAYLNEALERMRALPGVESAAITCQLPADGQFNLGVRVPDSADSEVRAQQWRYQTPDYFRTMGVRILHGRDFNASDTAGSMPVAIVNEAFARHFFPRQDAIGQRLEVMGNSALMPVIVGIAPDLKETGIDQPAPPAVYVPAAQQPDSLLRMVSAFIPIHWVIRMRPGAAGVERMAAEIARSLDPAQAMQPFEPMAAIVASQADENRFLMVLVSIFGGLALALAATGLYGTLSYLVEQRTHEIGVRMALGASSGNVLGSVVRSGMLLALSGAAAGLLSCLWLTRLVQGYIFGISRLDAPSFAGVTATLIVVALAACAVPAWRAARVDPMISLRAE